MHNSNINHSVTNVTDVNALSILEQLPGYVLCMDRDHKINYYCNDRCSYTLGFDNTEDVYGMKFEDLPTKAAHASDIFKLQNKQVINERESLNIIDIHPYRNDEVKVLLTHKTPLIDKNNNTIGVICQANEITQHTLLSITSTLIKADRKYHPNNNTNQRSYTISNIFKSELTQREMECLFYFVRGKTAKQIALILSLSKRTIEKHIANIKIKLHCATKSDLIEKVLHNNFINYIPEKFFIDINVNTSIIIQAI